MKLLFLADGASVHTKKWGVSLLKKGYQLHIVSLNAFDPHDYDIPGAKFSYTVFDLSRRRTILGGLNKIAYLKTAEDIKEIIKSYKPDLVHAHFASSYGMLASKLDFHPMIISVWGYDVLHFPKRSFLHRRILKENLSKADKILSTSHMMAAETALYTDKQIEVTPFGIDMDVFRPKVIVSESEFSKLNPNAFIIGTAKALEDKYAIDDLIRSFAILSDKFPNKPMQLAIAGDGASEKKLKELATQLSVSEKTVFMGHIDHRNISDFYNSIDVFAALSLEDSFGVAVIEAGACANPVIVSNVEGLPEVVENEVTGFIVPARDPEKAAEAFEKLLLDKSLRHMMGLAGRERVSSKYNWDRCVEQMNQIYLEMKDK